MHPSLKELISLLDLEEIDTSLFRGLHPAGRRKRLFGGQVIAQALVAATKTVEIEKIPHSLHAYFIRPGTWKVPVLLEVESVRNGRSFSTRRVLAIQDGEAILSMDISFQVKEGGLEHQMRDAPSFKPPKEDEMVDYYDWTMPLTKPAACSPPQEYDNTPFVEYQLSNGTPLSFLDETKVGFILPKFYYQQY